MAFNSSNARISLGCKIYVGATTLALPTDATTPLVEGYAHIGHTPEAGITIDGLKGTPNVIYAADHKTPLITTYTGDGPTISYDYAEIIPSNIILALNGTRTGNKIAVNTKKAGEKYRVIFDTEDQNDERPLRFVLPIAMVTATGSLSINPNDLFSLPTTWTGEMDYDVDADFLIFGEWDAVV